MKQSLKMLLFVACILLCFVRSQTAYDGPQCSCERNGITYNVSPAGTCSSFTISAPAHPTRTLSCPAGLMFNTQHCVCAYPESTVCPESCAAPVTPIARHDQPTPTAAPARLNCVDDIGPVFEMFNASLEAGRCVEAAELGLSFDLSCERSLDRLDDFTAISAIYLTYFAAGCPVRNITLPSFPSVCDGLVECATLNPENDFRAGCGVNDQIRFNSMSCYARYATAGCEIAGVILQRLSKFVARLCTRSCELARSDTRATDLAKMVAEAGRCDLALTILWDDISECDDSSDQDGAFQTMIDYYFLLIDILGNCPKLTQSQWTEPKCSPITICFQADSDRQIICGENNVNIQNGVDCLAEKTRNGCEHAQLFSGRYTAHARRVCPASNATTYLQI